MPSTGTWFLTLVKRITSTALCQWQSAVDVWKIQRKKRAAVRGCSPLLPEARFTGQRAEKLHWVLKRAGLPEVRFHDLRHTFTTLALQNGVDIKMVSAVREMAKLHR